VVVEEVSEPSSIHEESIRYWTIHRDFTLQGLPCRGSFFRCTVSSCRAIVNSVIYEQIVLPEEPEKTIEKEDARDRALMYLERSPDIRFYAEKYEVEPTEQIRKVIGKPSLSWHSYDDNESTIKQVDFDSSCFCWEVPFDMWSNVT